MNTIIQIILHPINYFRYYYLEAFGQRAYERVYTGEGNYTEKRGWLYKGNFYLLDIEDTNG